MLIPNAIARDPAQAWRIAVLTLIVLVVGCSGSNTSTAPPQPNDAAAPARDAAHRNVDALQIKVDEGTAALTKTEAELAKLKLEANESDKVAKQGADPTLRDSLTKKIAETEKSIADQRAEIDRLTKELTERNLELQKSQKAVDSVHNERNKN